LPLLSICRQKQCRDPYLGYTADGPASLKVLQSDVRLELLITDVSLPGGMNGRQMADIARVSRPDLKVLFITGYAENAVVGSGHLEPGDEGSDQALRDGGISLPD
jgi:CheY-like chemotaxis protein